MKKTMSFIVFGLGLFFMTATLTNASERYTAYVDSFELSGPGARWPGLDDFNDGLPGDWTNVGAKVFGQWEDELDTTYARLEGPGSSNNVSDGLKREMTKIFSFSSGAFWGIAGHGDFVGTVKISLPAIDQSVGLDFIYNYEINGRLVQDSNLIGLVDLSPQVAEKMGGSIAPGLYLHKRRYTFDGLTLDLLGVSDFEAIPIEIPEGTEDIFFSIEYIDDFLNPTFNLKYGLSTSTDFIAPFSPISSRLPWEQQGFWGIQTTLTYLSANAAIDIKPDSDDNTINIKNHGVIPVALLGTNAFDVSDVDVSTLRFGHAAALPLHDLTDTIVLNEHLQDENLDGYLDLIVHFKTSETGVACDDESIFISGWTDLGLHFEGFDSVVMIGCKSLKTPKCAHTTDEEYFISGGENPEVGIYVDDNLQVILNDQLVADIWQSGRCCPPADPIVFTANTGDTLRLVAKDANDCYSLESLYIQKVDGSCIWQLTDDVFGPNCGSEPYGQTFFDKEYTLP